MCPKNGGKEVVQYLVFVSSLPGSAPPPPCDGNSAYISQYKSLVHPREGAPRKSQQKRGLGSAFWTFFDFGHLKAFFGHFLLKMIRGQKITINWPKMHFNGQNRKKFRKQTLIIFLFYMKIYLLTFSGGPLC